MSSAAVTRAVDRCRDAFGAELGRLADAAEADEHRYALRYTLSDKRARALARQTRKTIDAMSSRAAACGRYASVVSRLCGHGKPRVVHQSCELPGCPVCGPARARREAQELAAKLAYAVEMVRAEHDLGERQRCELKGCDCHRPSPLAPSSRELGVHVRFLTLTTRTGEAAARETDVATLRWDIRQLKTCLRKLWRWLKSLGAAAMYAALELGERGMLHAHCCVVEPRWIAVEALSSRWLDWTTEAFGEGSWSVSVEAPYFTPRGHDGRKLRRADGKLVKVYGLGEPALKELCKYTVSPKTPPALAARFAVALRGSHRHFCYGLFRGVPEGVKELGRGDEPACPVCGCTEHMQTPFVPVEQLSEVAALCRIDAVLRHRKKRSEEDG